jgi:hypothetical protein
MYVEESAQLGAEASVAALILSNPECNDVEFLMLKPKRTAACELAELKARWPGRGLRSVGTIGLVGASPRWALKEPLTFEQISALADAFLAYLHVLFCDGFAAQEESAETAELDRLYALQDTRTEA